MRVLPIQSEHQLPTLIKVIVCGLKIVGLAPFSFQETENTVFIFSKIGLAYNMLLSILLMVAGVFAVPHMASRTYSNKSSITQAIEVTELILLTSTACIIIASVAIRQKKAISVMNRLLEVDRLLSGTKKYPRVENQSTIFLTAHVIFDALLWAAFWAFQDPYIDFSFDVIVHVSPFVIHWFVVEYSIVLTFATRGFKNLNKNLSNFQEFPNYFFRTPVMNSCNPPVLTSSTRSSQLAALELLHYIFITLSEVSEDIADFFSIPTLPSIASFFVMIVYNLYYLILPIVTSSSTFNMYIDGPAIVWVLVSVYPLILLSSNVTETLKEARLTGSIVHKVLARTTRPEIRKELERFSLQLTHENLSFTACGFFSLDFTLLQSIFGATLTYIAIIIQFTKSTANATDVSE